MLLVMKQKTNICKILAIGPWMANLSVLAPSVDL